MPVTFLLPGSPEKFPDPSQAEADGLLAIGGDLRPERLLEAYCGGIFPWEVVGGYPMWYSPDPRFVLPLDKLHISRSLRRVLNSHPFHITCDTAFEKVIRHCAWVSRPGQAGTWISREIISAYEMLHKLGFAHSIEAWKDNKLVGGMYGVSLGAAFFGESMFYTMPNASKVIMAKALAQFRDWGFHFLDCQMETPHMERFGAENWARTNFLSALKEALQYPTRKGSWAEEFGAKQ